MPVHVLPTMSRDATDETTDALMDDHVPDLHQVLDSVQCSMVLVDAAAHDVQRCLVGYGSGGASQPHQCLCHPESADTGIMRPHIVLYLRSAH